MSFSKRMKDEIGEELYKICDSGDISAVEVYFNPAPKTPQKPNSTDLFHKTSTKATLVETEAIPDEGPLSPMMEIAARNNDVPLAKYCLVHGWKLADQRGVLEQIRCHLPYKVYKTILEEEASDPNTRIFDPDSTIDAYITTFAAVNDDVDFVKLCFAHGATATLGSYEDHPTVLAAIAAKASVTMVALWLEQKFVEIHDSGAIAAAAAAGRGDTVLFLLDKGAGINDVHSRYTNIKSFHYCDEKSGSPLHQAVRNRRIAVCALLLRKGANVKLEDARGRTPLSLAESMGDSYLTRKLREYGAKK